MIDSNIIKLDKKQKLKQFLVKLPLVKYSPNVIEHSLLVNHIDPNLKINNTNTFVDIFSTEQIANDFLSTIKNIYMEKTLKGYKINQEIYPYRYLQFEPDQLEKITEYESFGKLISEYIQLIQPIETKIDVKIKEIQVKISKHEKIIINIENQIKSMEIKISETMNIINIIEENIHLIEDIFSKVHYFTTIPIEYNENINIHKIIQQNKEIIISINNKQLVLNYSKSVWENITDYYNKVKKIQEKKINGVEQFEKQIKINNKQNNFNKLKLSELVKNDIKLEMSNIKLEMSNITGQIKSNWFEQFNWFISSDGLLVISGKTAEQNEQIVKKYMNPNDIYIHSEVFGSGSCIIKNKDKTNISETYPRTIIESGLFIISHTKTWSIGGSNNAYWVLPSQVSKTPETGEYVSKGSFIIRGQKNLIIVDKLELGFGIIFKLKGKEEFISDVSLLTNLEEQIEYALPMVSPYTSQLKNKFRVKFIPGNQKIKKMLPEVLKLFYKKANLYEKNLIKKISNDSIQKVLINGVKFFL